MLMKEFVPFLLKTCVGQFHDDLRAIQGLHKTVVSVLALGEVHSLSNQSLLNENALLNDIELQNHEKLNWPDKRQKKRNGPCVV